MHLQWNDLYYPHTCLLLLGPSFILWGLFCTSCSHQLNTRSPHTSLSHIQHRVVCGCTAHKRTPPSEFQTVLSPTCISPRGAWMPVTRGSGWALHIGCFLFCRQPKQYISGGKSFFFFFACLHCLKADPPQRQIDFYSLYLLISKEKKAARVQRACARRNNTQGNCFFKIKCRE